jgi:hypothetical protein
MYVCMYVSILPQMVTLQEYLHRQWHMHQFGARNKMQSGSSSCRHWKIHSLWSSDIPCVSAYRIQKTCDKNTLQMRNSTVAWTKNNGDMTIIQFSCNNYHLVPRKTGRKKLSGGMTQVGAFIRTEQAYDYCKWLWWTKQSPVSCSQ